MSFPTAEIEQAEVGKQSGRTFEEEQEYQRQTSEVASGSQVKLDDTFASKHNTAADPFMDRALSEIEMSMKSEYERWSTPNNVAKTFMELFPGLQLTPGQAINQVVRTFASYARSLQTNPPDLGAQPWFQEQLVKLRDAFMRVNAQGATKPAAPRPALRLRGGVASEEREVEDLANIPDTGNAGYTYDQFLALANAGVVARDDTDRSFMTWNDYQTSWDPTQAVNKAALQAGADVILSEARKFINDDPSNVFDDGRYVELKNIVATVFHNVYRVRPLINTVPEYGNSDVSTMQNAVDAMMLHALAGLGKSLQRGFKDPRLKAVYDIWIQGWNMVTTTKRPTVDPKVKTTLQRRFDELYTASIADEGRSRRRRKKVSYREEDELWVPPDGFISPPPDRPVDKPPRPVAKPPSPNLDPNLVPDPPRRTPKKPGKFVVPAKVKKKAKAKRTVPAVNPDIVSPAPPKRKRNINLEGIPAKVVPTKIARPVFRIRTARNKDMYILQVTDGPEIRGKKPKAAVSVVLRDKYARLPDGTLREKNDPQLQIITSYLFDYYRKHNKFPSSHVQYILRSREKGASPSPELLEYDKRGMPARADRPKNYGLENWFKKKQVREGTGGLSTVYAAVDKYLNSKEVRDVLIATPKSVKEVVTQVLDALDLKEEDYVGKINITADPLDEPELRDTWRILVGQIQKRVKKNAKTDPPFRLLQSGKKAQEKESMRVFTGEIPTEPPRLLPPTWGTSPVPDDSVRQLSTMVQFEMSQNWPDRPMTNPQALAYVLERLKRRYNIQAPPGALGVMLKVNIANALRGGLSPQFKDRLAAYQKSLGKQQIQSPSRSSRRSVSANVGSEVAPYATPDRRSRSYSRSSLPMARNAREDQFIGPIPMRQLIESFGLNSEAAAWHRDMQSVLGMSTPDARAGRFRPAFSVALGEGRLSDVANFQNSLLENRGDAGTEEKIMDGDPEEKVDVAPPLPPTPEGTGWNSEWEIKPQKRPTIAMRFHAKRRAAMSTLRSSGTLSQFLLRLIDPVYQMVKKPDDPEQMSLTEPDFQRIADYIGTFSQEQTPEQGDSYKYGLLAQAALFALKGINREVRRENEDPSMPLTLSAVEDFESSLAAGDLVITSDLRGPINYIFENALGAKEATEFKKLYKTDLQQKVGRRRSDSAPEKRRAGPGMVTRPKSPLDEESIEEEIDLLQEEESETELPIPDPPAPAPTVGPLTVKFKGHTFRVISPDMSWTEMHLQHQDVFNRLNFTESDTYALYDLMKQKIAESTQPLPDKDPRYDAGPVDTGVSIGAFDMRLDGTVRPPFEVDRRSRTRSLQSFDSDATDVASDRTPAITVITITDDSSSVGGIRPGLHPNYPVYGQRHRGQGEANQHIVRLLSQKRYAMQPKNKFPYRGSKVVLDDKEHAEQFNGFVKAAALADPLSRLDGIKKKIGDHISINATPDRYHMIVWKDVPSRALKILCQEVKKHIQSLPRSAHIELFREVASQYKIVMSAQRLMNSGVKEIGRAILELLKRKRRGHYVHLVLLQTVPGGHLMRYEGLY